MRIRHRFTAGRRAAAGRAAVSATAVVESLEPRLLLSGAGVAMAEAEPSAWDQYMVELINRARADPPAEAARYGIDLNEGVPAGDTISPDPKPPLAVNLHLVYAARQHTQWILDEDTFSHTGAGGSGPHDRMEAAGYDFVPSWGSGENIGWIGTWPGVPEMTATTAENHESLFVDDGYPGRGHRVNMLSGDFKEIGAAVLDGVFTYPEDGGGETDYNAVVVTTDFAYSAGDAGLGLLTGVAYDDLALDDDFYTPGEGLGGVTITAVRQGDGQTFVTQTWSAGGYSLPLAAGSYEVRADGGGFDDALLGTVTLTGANVKLDAVPSSVTLPEIDVLGNGESIADGDVTPDAADHTDFGGAEVDGGAVTRTFTIRNAGTAALNLSGDPRVVIDGPAAADFAVLAQPDQAVSPGGSTTFEVRFDPDAAGLRSATIRIPNDDGDEDPYEFAVAGTGVETALPDLVVAFEAGTVPDVLYMSESFPLSVIVSNVGDGAAAGTTDIYLRASTDESWDEDDVPLAALLNYPADLPAGGATTFSVDVTVLANPPPGEFYLLARVDPENRIAESNEDNNVVVADSPSVAAWMFGDVPGPKDFKLTVRDAAGKPVTFSLSKGGYGEILGGADFTEIVLYETTDKSSLKIDPKGSSGEVSIGDVVVHGSLKALKAKKVNLLGDLTVEGGLGKLTLADVADDHTITIGEAEDPEAAVKMTFGSVQDTSIDSETPIKSIKATEWLDTDGVADRIQAPWIGKLTTTGDKKEDLAGDFQADLVLDGTGATTVTLKSAKIAGDLDGSTWNVTGEMGKLTVKGTARDVEVRAGGGIKGITLGAAEHADFLAGMSDAVVRHAQDGDDFEDLDATIKSFKIKGVKPTGDEEPPRWFFVDSNLSAGWIGKVSLLNVEFDNEEEGFGVWACDSGPDREIKSVKWSDKQDKAVKGKWPLAGDGDLDEPDLAVEMISLV